ncbi:EAL domain-containing protein [Caenispirillum bisanense]|uniref:EAL domain, c-di-GMP-specific phosphodiesterase class I (Or its enzymatically inactive variant) n=1 Tax=Caenispirillum bisanense TaxID=414052 RepID=A0A286GBQ7_9PROT|nr:EAL domain-containing protein [Caenispirillum bisanense]SOD92676.1 EAL domain, c-di-GMP-specific phosphodiesterase class I (or its enzymatically inactive variant) [Caenispirillum bisanense]
MSQDDSITRLRAQKSRFIAFAFAGNDVLIEVDDDGRIVYCGGVVENVLGRDAADLKSGFVHDFVAGCDVLLFDELLLRLRRSGRLDRVPVHVEGKDSRQRRVYLSGLTMPEDPTRAYLAMTAVKERTVPPRKSKTVPVTAEVFADTVKRRLESGEAPEDAKLTLLDLGPEVVGAALPADKVDGFMTQAMDFLSAWSVGGDCVGRLQDGTVGVLHDGTLAEADIRDRLNQMVAVFEPGAPPLDLRIAGIEASASGMSEEDLSKALVYTFNTFAKGAETLSMDSLSAGYKAAMNEAIAKVVAFRNAIGSNLRLVFQPIVDLTGWQVHHYEALARLESNERLVAPAALIDFAENFGVVQELDMAVVRQALQVLGANRMVRGGAKIAVNLSGRSIGNDAFCHDLMALLQQHDHLLPRLKFEVTESHEIADLARVNAVLQELRRRSCPVCIDDFGSGAAAFQYLRALEVDYLKIDGAYIREAFTDRCGRPFLRAIAGLARDLGIKCIGEMVENAETMWLLRELGIGYGQGWFFGKPNLDVSRFVLGDKPEGFGRRPAN